MKKILKALCAFTLVFALAACTEKDNNEQTQNNGNNNGNGGGNYSSLILGTWRVDQMSVDGQNMTPEYMTLSFYENGTGLMDDGDASHHNDFRWAISGNNTTVSTDNHEFLFIIDELDATGCRFHTTYVEFVEGQAVNGDIRFFMTKIPTQLDPGDLGIGTPELSEKTDHSLTLTSHVTGSVDQYLWQFPNYTCGLIWCPASNGTPTMNSSSYTADGDNIYYVIDGLNAGTDYNVAAWLKLTPDSEPIISEVRTYTTENGGSNDTNWIHFDNAMATGSTTISVTVTAYFDSDPRAVGVVYSTGTTPTITDNVYDAFEHLNMETGEYDETIQRVQENADGSRTVAALLTNLQSNTTYRLRAFFKMPDGSVTYSDEEITVTTE